MDGDIVEKEKEDIKIPVKVCGDVLNKDENEIAINANESSGETASMVQQNLEITCNGDNTENIPEGHSVDNTTVSNGVSTPSTEHAPAFPAISHSIADDEQQEQQTQQQQDKHNDDQLQHEYIDIDEFLVRSGQCGRFQFMIVLKIMLMTFPLSYPVFIFYFISYDPPWINLVNETSHSKEDLSRCSLNRSHWTYDYDKRTITTEYDLICDKSWLLSLSGSVVFIGWAIGCLILGFLSDLYGRKSVLVPCLFLDVGCLFLHVFVDSIWMLIVLRFFMGFFHASPALNSFILLVELIGPSYRVLAANIAGIIWAFGTSILALKAYLVDDWRMLCFIASAPYVGFLFIGFWFPESVRWLNTNGRTDRAERILHRAARVNKRPLENVSIIPIVNPDGRKTSYLQLFDSWKMTKNSLCHAFIWFNCGMVYYTLAWAFADLGGGDLYLNFVLGAVVELPMHAVAIVCLQSFGRRATTWCSFLVTCLSCSVVVFLVLVNHFGVFKLIFGLIGKSSISLAFMCIYMWSSEIFPTVVRTQGLGFSIIASRIGAAISPFTNNLDLIHPTLPFLVMACFCLVAVVLCFALPETLGKATRETMEDMWEKNDVDYQ